LNNKKKVKSYLLSEMKKSPALPTITGELGFASGFTII
jgi:hypothetical protein